MKHPTKISKYILPSSLVISACLLLAEGCTSSKPKMDEPVDRPLDQTSTQAVLEPSNINTNTPSPGESAKAQTNNAANQVQPPTTSPAPAAENLPQSVNAAANPTQIASTPGVSDVPDDCDTTTKFNDQEPIFLPENKVMLTRVMSSCMSRSGVPGHKKNAGWMAMGFPCTGGDGRIDWKGTNYNSPKMVSFLLETSCAMAPKDHTQIHLEATKMIGLSTSAPMIAFNPMVIQYWEVPGYPEADATFTVDLRSAKGLREAWIRFIKPKPLRIMLVGRENAWVPGNHMYVVEGDLIWSNKNRFEFKVETARLLKEPELSQVKLRCESLKPERECSRVF